MIRPGCEWTVEVVSRLRHDLATPVPDEVALHLDECDECRQRFDSDRVELDRQAFERLGEARRQAIVGALAAARSAARWRRAASLASAAAAAFLAAVGLAAYHLGEPDDPAVATALVEDHIRYLDHADRSSGDDPAALTADLAGHVDFPVRLVRPPESRLTGARRCYVLGRRVVLAFYDTPVGPASYFALEAQGLSPARGPCPTEPDLACRRVKGYLVVTWEEAGLLHALVGPDRRGVESLAAALRRAVSEDDD